MKDSRLKDQQKNITYRFRVVRHSQDEMLNCHGIQQMSSNINHCLRHYNRVMYHLSSVTNINAVFVVNR